MKASKTKIAFTCAVALIIAFTVASCKSEPPSEDPDLILQRQTSQIGYGFRFTSKDFQKNIQLVEKTDSEGNPYCIGEISPELDAILDQLVDSYNTDPRTTEHITVEEVRYCLTEGIVEATDYSIKESNFLSFLLWCNSPADLVYKEYDTDPGGIEHHPGESVGDTNTSNYE